MTPAEKNRSSNPSSSKENATFAAAPTVRADDAEPNTMTAERGDRANPFGALDVATTPTMPNLEAGTVVKHYEFIRPLGAGGMGTVFLARDMRLGRLVAIKVLLKYTGHAAFRFLAEARATALCRHENIVVIYDVDEYAGYPYMVLEYIEGTGLREAMTDPSRNRVTFAIEAMLSVARALVRAHEMGIVHRDLKPENILLSNDGQIKVLDFGIAKQVSEVAAEMSQASALPVETKRATLTQAGALVGTLGYMSPEQVKGEIIDERTDIWAVGVILYELLTGERFLRVDSFVQIADVIRAIETLPSVREKWPELGASADVIDRCLKRNKAERFGSAKELLAALERVGARKGVLVKENHSLVGAVDHQEIDAAGLPQPDTFDAVVPDMSPKTGDLQEILGKDSGLEAPPTLKSVQKPRRLGWARWGGIGLAMAALVVSGVVLKRKTPQAPMLPPVVSALDCTAADVTGTDATADFANALGMGACLRLGIELGIPSHISGGTRLGVRAQGVGKESAVVTLELAGKTVEGTGKTPIGATNDAIQKLAPMVAVPAFSPERIAGWGARDEASARRIERGVRKFAFGFAERRPIADALLQTDPDSPVSHAMLACSVKWQDPALARAEKEEARKRLSKMTEKRAKLVAATMGTFIHTPDDENADVKMSDSYTELSQDPDFGSLYTLCGCVMTEGSLPMLDWLAKHQPVNALPIARCGRYFTREASPERLKQYLDWIGPIFPELRATDIGQILSVEGIDSARKALDTSEQLGAERTTAFDVAQDRAILLFSSFDTQAAFNTGDQLLGQPDLRLSHYGALMRIHSFVMAGKMLKAQQMINHELSSLELKQDEAAFLDLAWYAMRLRRLTGHEPLDANQVEEIRARMKNVLLGRAGVLPELWLMSLDKSNKATAKADLDRILNKSDPEFKELTMAIRSAFAFPLVRVIRGNNAAATIYTAMELRLGNRVAGFEAGLVFEAIGAKAEAEKAYRASMEEPWQQPFDAVAARVRLADLLHADGREKEASEMLAVVDKVWAEADIGLREAVRRMK